MLQISPQSEQLLALIVKGLIFFCCPSVQFNHTWRPTVDQECSVNWVASDLNPELLLCLEVDTHKPLCAPRATWPT
jgi:hypothetical protein